MKRSIIGALFLATALLVAACSSSDISQDDFEKALVDDADLSPEVAACVTEASYEKFDQDQINDLYTAAERADLEGTVADDFDEIVRTCTGAG